MDNTSISDSVSLYRHSTPSRQPINVNHYSRLSGFGYAHKFERARMQEALSRLALFLFLFYRS